MKKIKQMRYSVSFLIAAILLVSCSNSEDTGGITTETATINEEDNLVMLTEAQLNMAGITLGSVEKKQISGTFKANGVLDVPPQQMVSISIPMGGFLKRTDMLQGKRVRKGELIAVIENPDYIPMQQDYLEAKSQLEYAQADYERQEELAKENINAQKTLQHSKATYQSLKAKVAASKEKIRASGINLSAVENGDIQSYVNIYAPISGFVTEVNVNTGKYVSPSDVLFEIVNTEHLHVELTVFEKDVPKLQIGQKVRFTLANETNERTATVYLIGRKISDDRTVRIHCHIDKEDIHLLPGMYLKAIVETGHDQVPALPDEAIVDFEGQKYIFVALEQKSKSGRYFKMVPVQTGSSDMGYTEVALPEGVDHSKIVVKGAYALLSKMKNSEE